jgi:hypothetical protein
MKKQITSLKSIFGTVALLVAMLTPNLSWGQVTIATQDFETTPATQQ